eukprot:5461673-Lingulodinium_polyedra.AAC.1
MEAQVQWTCCQRSLVWSSASSSGAHSLPADGAPWPPLAEPCCVPSQWVWTSWWLSLEQTRQPPTTTSVGGPSCARSTGSSCSWGP